MIILDRGALDGSAYTDEESLSTVLSACGVDAHEMQWMRPLRLTKRREKFDFARDAKMETARTLIRPEPITARGRTAADDPRDKHHSLALLLMLSRVCPIFSKLGVR
ncbi:hypothetical protein niasHT_025143 [Heterodera trifolii]|uniref:Uncharacterized protein n=1 Tax=Heterodera trifolii TaxID=157864 RepID=A0ABD2K1S4_9BILA